MITAIQSLKIFFSISTGESYPEMIFTHDFVLCFCKSFPENCLVCSQIFCDSGLETTIAQSKVKIISFCVLPRFSNFSRKKCSESHIFWRAWAHSQAEFILSLSFTFFHIKSSLNFDSLEYEHMLSLIRLTHCAIAFIKRMSGEWNKLSFNIHMAMRKTFRGCPAEVDSLSSRFPSKKRKEANRVHFPRRFFYIGPETDLSLDFQLFVRSKVRRAEL